jgi:hypothetical protein
MQHIDKCVTFDRFSCMLQFFCAGTYHLRKMRSSYNILLVCSENKLPNSLHEGRAYHVPAATTILCTFYFVVANRAFYLKRQKKHKWGAYSQDHVWPLLTWMEVWIYKPEGKKMDAWMKSRMYLIYSVWTNQLLTTVAVPITRGQHIVHVFFA